MSAGPVGRGAASGTADGGVAREEVVTLQLAGLLCAENCQPNVELALKGVQGVRQAVVDFASSQATVTLDPSLTGADTTQVGSGTDIWKTDR